MQTEISILRRISRSLFAATAVSAAFVIAIRQVDACSPLMPQSPIIFESQSATLNQAMSGYLQKFVDTYNPRCWIWHIEVNLDGSEGLLPPSEAAELGRRRAAAITDLVLPQGFEIAKVIQLGASRPYVEAPPGTSEPSNRMTWIRGIWYADEVRGIPIPHTFPADYVFPCGPPHELVDRYGSRCFRV